MSGDCLYPGLLLSVQSKTVKSVEVRVSLSHTGHGLRICITEMKVVGTSSMLRYGLHSDN